MFSTLLRTAILPLSLVGLAACGSAPGPADNASSESHVAKLSDGALISMACSGCHSDQAGEIVSLSNHSESQLVEALSQYKSETDGTTVMHRLARGYSDDDIAKIGAYLGTKQGPD